MSLFHDMFVVDIKHSRETTHRSHEVSSPSIIMGWTLFSV